MRHMTVRRDQGTVAPYAIHTFNTTASLHLKTHKNKMGNADEEPRAAYNRQSCGEGKKINEDRERQLEKEFR